MPARYSPYCWEFQDAEKVTSPDGSFDFVGVHSGLHHCYSPAGAAGEMRRLARKGIFLFEPHDTAFVRLALASALVRSTNTPQFFGNNLTHGGVANTALPNFVYRFTRRELERRCVPAGRGATGDLWAAH
ncbi:MAG: methyltransferase domain-containing protein [Verrucomicrobiales bacterium]